MITGTTVPARSGVVVPHPTPARELFEAIEAVGVSAVVERSLSRHYTHQISTSSAADAHRVAADLLLRVQVSQLLVIGHRVHVLMP